MGSCGVSPKNKMDADELCLWILRRLGAPLLKVELTEEHCRDSVSIALRWFAAKKGFIRDYRLQLIPNVTEYVLPDDVDIVTEVVFPFSDYDITPYASPWAWAWPNENMMVPFGYGGSYGQGSQGETGGYLSSWQQVLQYTDTARRILGADPEWRQENRTLYLLPRKLSPTTPKAIVYYTSNTFDLLDLNQRDFDLVRRYALAQAKLDLGRIRSKYDQYPTAQGSTGLDGNTLLGEGQQEIEVLNEEIADSAMPIGFMVG